MDKQGKCIRVNNSPALVFNEYELQQGILRLIQQHANAIPASTRLTLSKELVEALSVSVNVIQPTPLRTRDLYAANKARIAANYENQFRSDI